MGTKLTDKIVRSLAAPSKGNRITYDSEVLGFGAQITASGARAFIVNYRVKGTGLERRYTIGNFPDWTVSVAREKAKELKREVDSGGDPLGKIKGDREAPTVADLCAKFTEEHLDKLRSKTRQDYKSVIDREIVPALGKLKVTAVDYEHVERLHGKISQGTTTRAKAPIRANRALAVLSKMFALAIKWRMRPDNPCKGIERNREHARKRYLSPDELARLTEALAKYRDQEVADIFRLLLLTGARRTEVLSARKEQFDLKQGIWTKPPASAKQKVEHRIPLSAPAREIIARVHKDGDDDQPWLFPGHGSQHRINLDHAWRRICRVAGITNLRIHDLRHSYASALVGEGLSLPIIGALLGHSQPQTTARYAHLLDDPLRKATERAGAILAPILGHRPQKASGKVTKFPARAGK